MGIEKLKGSLLSEAGEDAGKILSESQAKAKLILDEERGKRAASKAEAEKSVEKTLAEQKNERIAWARLESKRIIAEAREDAIKSVLEEFFEELGSVRKSQEYRKFLADAAASAVAELGTGATIHVAKGDKALISAPKGAKVVEDLEGLGGAMVESDDGKIRVDMTLETLFESRRDDMRKRIYENLFGGR
ncbi:MAG TPA: V-type ATP synthase subunit E [Candidatus Bilamarchaeum sp.]|nr:V-type ATP synthase subunit E [Candidatus Bilamarchaeum sp.]